MNPFKEVFRKICYQCFEMGADFGRRADSQRVATRKEYFASEVFPQIEQRMEGMNPNGR